MLPQAAASCTSKTLASTQPIARYAMSASASGHRTAREKAGSQAYLILDLSVCACVEESLHSVGVAVVAGKMEGRLLEVTLLVHIRPARNQQPDRRLVTWPHYYLFQYEVLQKTIEGVRPRRAAQCSGGYLDLSSSPAKFTSTPLPPDSSISSLWQSPS